MQVSPPDRIRNMDFQLDPNLEAFRQEVRAAIQADLPARRVEGDAGDIVCGNAGFLERVPNGFAHC